MLDFRHKNPVYLKTLTTNYDSVIGSSTQTVKLIPAEVINSCLMKFILRTVRITVHLPKDY